MLVKEIYCYEAIDFCNYNRNEPIFSFELFRSFLANAVHIFN